MATVYHPHDQGYEARRSGFNLAVENRPAVIVDAGSADDVVAAVQLATGSGRPVAVMATGHGPSVPADDAVLIRTDGMTGVDVDPVRRTARVTGGTRWRAVVDAAGRHGLAPLNGSSPHVGVVGYTLAGGIGLLARRFGFAADHVRRIEVVTADGSLRHVTADPGGDDPDGDLFWALRGAGANFGVVTAVELDLFPVATLLGGELGFGADAADDVLHAYADWARAVPETIASSLLLLRYPDDPAVPDDVRDRHITHIRVAHSRAEGDDDHAEGEAWVERLRRIAPPVLDTVRVMPYTDVGTIHHEPVDEPVPAFDRNILLRDLDHDAVDLLAKHAGPGADAPFLTELRAWGGALARPPDVPNAVAGRDAAFSLLAISDPDPTDRARRDTLLTAMAPWGTGGTYPNFAGVEDTAFDAVRRGFRPDDLARLQALKARLDPDNVFRINHNIPPTPHPRTGDPS